MQQGQSNKESPQDPSRGLATESTVDQNPDGSNRDAQPEEGNAAVGETEMELNDIQKNAQLSEVVPQGEEAIENSDNTQDIVENDTEPAPGEDDLPDNAGQDNLPRESLRVSDIPADPIIGEEELRALNAQMEQELAAMRAQIAEKQRSLAPKPEPEDAVDNLAASAIQQVPQGFFQGDLAYFGERDTVCHTVAVLDAVENTYPAQEDSLTELYRMMRGSASAPQKSVSATRAQKNSAPTPQETQARKQQLAARHQAAYLARKQRCELHAKMPPPDNARALGVDAERPRQGMHGCSGLVATAEGDLTYTDLYDEFLLSGLAVPPQVTHRMTREEATLASKKRLFWLQKMREHAGRVLRALEAQDVE